MSYPEPPKLPDDQRFLLFAAGAVASWALVFTLFIWLERAIWWLVS